MNYESSLVMIECLKIEKLSYIYISLAKLETGFTRQHFGNIWHATLLKRVSAIPLVQHEAT